MLAPIYLVGSKSEMLSRVHISVCKYIISLKLCVYYHILTSISHNGKCAVFENNYRAQTFASKHRFRFRGYDCNP